MFGYKPRKTTPNTKDFLPLSTPIKTLEKKTAEHPRNTKEFPCLENAKENQNTKEWKIRVFHNVQAIRANRLKPAIRNS